MFRSSREEADLALCLGALGTVPSQPGQAQPADFGRNLLIAVRNYNRLTKRTMKIDGGNCGNAYKKAATVAIS